MSMFEALENDRLPGRARTGGEGDGNAAPEFALQTTLGNSAIARMLQREPDEEVEEEALQAKHDPSLQRESADMSEMPEEEEVEDTLQAKHDTSVQRAPEVGLAGGAISDGLSGRIDSQRGSGSPLDDTTRDTMEGALGTSLADVRVHVGSESDELNQAITAKAFTTGNDVFVRSDQWSPGSSSTQRLMAHELTHVAQQRSGDVATDGGGMSVGAADTHHEREADEVAEAVASQSTSSASAQREEDDER
jgi:Domain of unknown function (DUF4157)